MRLFNISLTVVAFGVLAGCANTYSTARDEGLGFAITRTQAKEIVNSSILTHFSPDMVNQGPPESLTSSGYMRFIVDTHTINATAIPVKGAASDGSVRDGYGFEISTQGTMLRGEAKAKDVYELLKRQGATAGETLRVAK